MATITDPIDQTHIECLAAKKWIRQEIALMKTKVSMWEPKKIPENWRPW